jgi:hypothetical protein
MLVTPSSSVGTVKPATAVVNHRKVRRREKAGRSRLIAFHQRIHSNIESSSFVVEQRSPATH